MVGPTDTRQPDGQSPLRTPVSRHIWATRYRAPGESLVTHTWQRVAHAVAQVETAQHDYWETAFYQLLEDFRFLPGGRILAGAGLARDTTLSNCFVMGILPDSMAGIFAHLREAAITLQQGGGIGHDFSTLRPAGVSAAGCGTTASGPVSFMRVWDAMCATVMSTGTRRGAMMATLRCDHPDVAQFIDAKRDPGQLRHFNLSVQVSDAFMRAVEEDASWPLVFPDTDPAVEGVRVLRRWTDSASEVPCRVHAVPRARDLWQQLLRAAYESAEPGVLFIDQINRENTLQGSEWLTCTNPCGEVPLPPYGACNLGSLNLTAFIHAPFRTGAAVDFHGLQRAAALAVRFLDNIVTLSRYPLPRQAAQALATRRIGLGISGLADALAMLGVEYDSAGGRTLAALIMRTVCEAGYRASLGLAREKGPFPACQAQHHAGSRFIERLPADIREGIRAHGIRNSHVLAIAPAGTISLLANNISGGIEPIFALRARRRVLEADGSPRHHDVEDYAWQVWQRLHPGLPPCAAFVEARAISPVAHLEMQAVLQPFVDNAISKTINVAADIPYAEFADLYRRAWREGLKGCTVFRPNDITGAVLEAGDDFVPPDRHCCDPLREAD